VGAINIYMVIGLTLAVATSLSLIFTSSRVPLGLGTPIYGLGLFFRCVFQPPLSLAPLMQAVRKDPLLPRDIPRFVAVRAERGQG
jgi:hypothetical protein